MPDPSSSAYFHSNLIQHSMAAMLDVLSSFGEK